VGGFDCAVDEKELKELADAVFPGAGATIPSFDLGGEPTALFDYTMNPLMLAGICQASISEEIPVFIELPSCEDALTVQVRLDLVVGDEEITSVKDLELVFDPAAPLNGNPSLGAVRASLEAEDGAPIELPEDSPAELERGRTYRLEVDVPDGASEEYLPEATDDDPEPERTSESLFLSWYVTGGETEFGRTTFFPDEPDLTALGENSWETPEADDYEDDEASLFLVIQDQRGGLGWIERTVRLVEQEQ
jgi:hypothetical protein